MEFYEPFSYEWEVGASAGRRSRRRFYVAIGRRLGGPILEVGCGTGEITLALARSGVRVVGLDRSPAMLQRCQQRLASEPSAVRTRVTLVQGAMEKLEMPARFAAIFVPYHALFHVLDPATLDDTLGRMLGHLHGGGTLALDLFTVDPAQMARLALGDDALCLVGETTTPRGVYRVYEQSSYEFVSQRLSTTFRYELLDNERHVRDVWYRTLDYRVSTPEELGLRLKLSGFIDVQAWGAFRRGSALQAGRPFARPTGQTR
jgi:ubiquinone/menaquinone biosynthesis C-methylase UbiE